MNYNELWAKISREYWKREEVAGYVQRYFHRKEGVIDPSFLAVDSPMTGDFVIGSGDYVIMPRLEIASGVTLTLDGELVLIA